MPPKIGIFLKSVDRNIKTIYNETRLYRLILVWNDVICDGVSRTAVKMKE